MKNILSILILCAFSIDAYSHNHQPSKSDSSDCLTCAEGCSVRDSSFNPSFSVILDAKYKQFSANNSEMTGFYIGHEGERSETEGFGLDHTEFAFTANADDKFRGSAVFALAEHDGEAEIELEEAFVETLPGFEFAGITLPSGMSIKAGRAFWTLGYLNERHAHSDDFADRPLPYRAFFDKHFNDDGAQVSYVLPTDLYTEIGGSTLRGNDFPFGSSSDHGNEAWSLYGRVGKNLSNNQSIRVGAYLLTGNMGSGRDLLSGHDDHGHDDHGHDGDHEIAGIKFTGDTSFFITDVRYTWAPTGDADQKELILQAEYFQRTEDGIYTITEGEGNQQTSEAVDFNDIEASGWYAQSVYKFSPKWRAGLRYSQLQSPSVPAEFYAEHDELNPDGYNPEALSYMLDYSNSKYSRLRLQYNQEELSDGNDDKQLMLQYIVSLGAHSVH